MLRERGRFSLWKQNNFVVVIPIFRFEEINFLILKWTVHKKQFWINYVEKYSFRREELHLLWKSEEFLHVFLFFFLRRNSKLSQVFFLHKKFFMRKSLKGVLYWPIREFLIFKGCQGKLGRAKRSKRPDLSSFQNIEFCLVKCWPKFFSLQKRWIGKPVR